MTSRFNSSKELNWMFFFNIIENTETAVKWQCSTFPANQTIESKIFDEETSERCLRNKRQRDALETRSTVRKGGQRCFCWSEIVSKIRASDLILWEHQSRSLRLFWWLCLIYLDISLQRVYFYLQNNDLKHKYHAPTKLWKNRRRPCRCSREFSTRIER